MSYATSLMALGLPDSLAKKIANSPVFDTTVRVSSDGTSYVDIENAATIRMSNGTETASINITSAGLNINAYSGSEKHVTIKPGGHFMFATKDAPVSDADLLAGYSGVYLNEAGNALTFKCKYAGGTVKTGTVALT